MRYLKKNKYSAVKTTIDGITFDSKFEASYYAQLKLLEKTGKVKIIELQPKVYLTEARILYKPDFLIEENGVLTWIDVKGMPTPGFNVKKRLWRYYGPGELRIIYKHKIEVVKVNQ
jgi:hypothetical protein